MLQPDMVVRGVGAMGVVVLAIALWALFDARRTHLTVRPIAIELARSEEEVRDMLQPGDSISGMQRQIYIDNRFIAAYWLFFLGAALLFRWVSPAGEWWNTGVTAVLATAAAICDLQENRGILKTVQAFPKIDPAGVRDTREVSMLKWLLLFIVLLMLAQLFIQRSDAWRWVGITLAAAALVGIVGLVWGVRQPVISVGFSLAFGGLLAATVQWLAWPGLFLGQR